MTNCTASVHRLGVFGGTFDPVHIAHLFIARNAADCFQLDRVLFVPNSISPFKTTEPVTPVHDRLEMLKLATEGEARFAISDIEAYRSGPSYTVDTLRQIHHENPGAELFFLTGFDTAAEIPTWREPDVVFELATIIAAVRPGVDSESVQRLPGRVSIMQTPLLDLSSTIVRERMASGQTVKYLVPDSVIEYAEHKGLYR